VTISTKEPSMSASAVRRLTAAGLASLAIGAVLAAPAMAGPLDRAEQAARAATAPEPVLAAVCLPADKQKRSGRSRRALCLLAHPAPEGTICRSLVSVRMSGNVRSVKLIRRVCLAVPDLRPEFRP
jgi:hypothetical protein